MWVMYPESGESRLHLHTSHSQREIRYIALLFVQYDFEEMLLHDRKANAITFLKCQNNSYCTNHSAILAYMTR